MTSKDIEAWGRHYDTLLWTVTTIMATAIGALLVYVSSNFDPCLAIFGFILTILAVYFAASFRELRHKVEEHYDKECPEIAEVLRTRRFPQWWAYLLIFIMLGVLWIKLLIKKYPDLLCIWIVIGVIGIALMTYLGYKSGGIKTNVVR